VTYHLLCRWQTGLEFFLYQLCKTTAPGLIDDCHWSCAEAAELTRLSEKVTEFFCFHHKPIFKDCGISEQERESFCSDLQEIRQIRHCAVHRVDINAATINKYAKCALHVLGTIKRLGGQGFRKDHGEAVCPVPFPSHYNNRSPRHELQLDRFVNSFWETERHLILQASSHISPSQHEEQNPGHNSKKAEGARLREAQQDDAQPTKAKEAEHSQKHHDDAQPTKAKKAEHSQKQQDDAQLKKAKKAEHSQQQQDDAQLKKAKKTEHSQKQQDDAQLKKAKKAEHSQQQQDDAQPTKAKEAEHSQKHHDDAQPTKAKKAEHSQQQQDDAQLKKAKKAEHSQKQQDDAQLKKAKKAEHNQQQQDDAQLKKAKKAEHSQKQQGDARPKKYMRTVNIQKICASSNMCKGKSTICTHTT
jgi:hypothetical protein